MNVTVNRDQLQRVVDELQAGEPLTGDRLVRIFGTQPVVGLFYNGSDLEFLAGVRRTDLYRAAAITGALAMQTNRNLDVVNVATILKSADAVVTALREKGILS